MGTSIEHIKLHYDSSHKMLLVGEGDFSFSACLAKAFGTASNMVATSLDSRACLLIKYPFSAESHLKELENSDCLVLHEVDVHCMNAHSILQTMKFDRIVFNFPHAGHFGSRETVPYVIEMHKNLVLAFFKSALKMLSESGEVHVTHRDDHPYNRWEIVELAKSAGLDLKEKVWFNEWRYIGYSNKRGGDIRSNESFPTGSESYTFKFELA